MVQLIYEDNAPFFLIIWLLDFIIILNERKIVYQYLILFVMNKTIRGFIKTCCAVKTRLSLSKLSMLDCFNQII